MIIISNFGRREIAQITYATIGSIKNLGAEFKRLGFTKMLIDEAHLYPREADSMLGRFLADSGITHVLGITATPVKLQTNRDREGSTFSKLVMLTSRSKKGNFFKEIIHVGQVSEMVKLGYWSKLLYEASDFDDSLLVFNTSKSEYTEESVQQAYEANGGTQAIDTRVNALIEIMPFGKYKGNRIADIPLQYRQWMIRTFEWNARNEKLRKSIIATF